MRTRILLAALLIAAGPAQAWKHGCASCGGGSGPSPAGPGLVLGTYGATGDSGWTHIGPSTGAQASTKVTNIIYVSDSLGNDMRDGSTPTFVDDNTTEQFALTALVSPVAGDVYRTPNGSHFTVAVSVTNQANLQTTARTGLPDAPPNTLSCLTTCTGPSSMNYTAVAPGIHGPVQTLIKGAGGTGPGLYNLDRNGSIDGNTGDGTGLGTQGNWRTAGSVAASFGLRGGAPDWLLLRKGDTFVGQAIETGWSSMWGGDNFSKGGFSEFEPMVISSYDENFPVATYGANASNGKARPIVQVPGSNSTYAFSQAAGTIHSYQSRPGIALQGGSVSYTAIMGIEFYVAQRDPTNSTPSGPGSYSGFANIDAGVNAIIVPGFAIGMLIEDVKAGYAATTIAFNVGSKDAYFRRNQIHHCYTRTGIGADKAGVGFALDNIGDNGSPIWHGFSFEENVMDQCGYVNNFASNSGNIYARNAYIQWDSVLGSRKGNTSIRSGSESFQFRSGGIIDNEFTYNGSYGMDVGHEEGDPALSSTTQVTNNVIMSPDSPNGVSPIGFNMINSNNITASNNLIVSTASTPGPWLETDAYQGETQFVHLSNLGSGGTPGSYGCIGLNHMTGGHGTAVSSYSMTVGAGGTGPSGTLFAVDWVTGQTFLVGDVLTPVANHPSLNTAGVSLTNAGTGGTRGAYGFVGGNTTMGGCDYDPSNSTLGTVQGTALTGGAGSGALVAYTIGLDTNSTTRALNAGNYQVTSTTQSFTEPQQGAHPNVNHGIAVSGSFTTSGFVPTAYNGTWTALAGTTGSTLVWSVGPSDPGPITTEGSVTSGGNANSITQWRIVGTGAAYVVGNTLTASAGGITGAQWTVNTVAHWSGWQMTVDSVTTSGVHGLNFTNNIVFNWPAAGPHDQGGTHDAPGGIAGSGAANTFTSNIIGSTTDAQFTGVISSGALTTSALVSGTIAVGQNLAGPGVAANTTITGGPGPTSWTVTPSQTVASATMYGYTMTPATVFPHPELTIGSYAATLSLPATVDGYVYGSATPNTGAINNARWNWNPALTAAQINHYIRQGFGMTP